MKKINILIISFILFFSYNVCVNAISCEENQLKVNFKCADGSEEFVCGTWGESIDDIRKKSTCGNSFDEKEYSFSYKLNAYSKMDDEGCQEGNVNVFKSLYFCEQNDNFFWGDNRETGCELIEADYMDMVGNLFCRASDKVDVIDLDLQVESKKIYIKIDPNDGSGECPSADILESGVSIIDKKIEFLFNCNTIKKNGFIASGFIVKREKDGKWLCENEVWNEKCDAYFIVKNNSLVSFDTKYMDAEETYILYAQFNSSTPKVSCGKVTNIPKKIPELTSWIVTLIQIIVPILLVILGMIDLFKAMSSQKEDEIKRGQQMLIKRITTAVLIFFIIVIVKVVVSLVAKGDSNTFMDCIDCFIDNDCDLYTNVNVPD